MVKFWAIQRISTGKIVRRFSHANPANPTDEDLKLIPVKHGALPKIDVELQGVGFKEEIKDGGILVTFIAFKITDGPLKPIELQKERLSDNKKIS